jgi:hypothetical protein
MDDEEKRRPAIVWGILSAALDWTPEERAAALEEAEADDNVIYLAEYRLH